MTMIPVKVANVSISNVGFVVFLKSRQENRTLPIFIGVQEAQAIAIELNNVTPPRPLTHDLMKNILDALEARLERVIVHTLQDGTFYAKLILAFEGQDIEVDSRPSDGIALALRYKAPLFVGEDVMKEAGIVMAEDGEASEAKEPPVKDRLSELRDQLSKAVREERYEDAARLRDEIRDATQTN
jgi:bifunctional DNase/RNase